MHSKRTYVEISNSDCQANRLQLLYTDLWIYIVCIHHSTCSVSFQYTRQFDALNLFHHHIHLIKNWCNIVLSQRSVPGYTHYRFTVPVFCLQFLRRFIIFCTQHLICISIAFCVFLTNGCCYFDSKFQFVYLVYLVSKEEKKMYYFIEINKHDGGMSLIPLSVTCHACQDTLSIGKNNSKFKL